MSLEITLDDLKQAVNESYNKRWWSETTSRANIVETIYGYLTDRTVGGMGMLTTTLSDANKILNALSNSVLEAKDGLPNGLVCKGTTVSSSFPEKINNCLIKYMGVQPTGSYNEPSNENKRISIQYPNDEVIKRAPSSAEGDNWLSDFPVSVSASVSSEPVPEGPPRHSQTGAEVSTESPNPIMRKFLPKFAPKITDNVAKGLLSLIVVILFILILIAIGYKTMRRRN